MKSKAILLVISTVFYNPGGGSGIPDPSIDRTVYLSMSDIGPYEKYASDPTITFNEKSYYNKTLTIKEIFRFGDKTNSNQKTITKANHTISAYGTYSNTISFPTSYLLGANGFTVAVEIYNVSTSSLITSVNFSINAKSHQTIDPTKMTSYTCNTTKVNIVNNEVRYVNETYTFSNVIDYFNTDIYYRLPIEQFVINKEFEEEATHYISSYLIIDGLQTHFPSLYHQNGVARIPLSVVETSNTIQLAFKNQLYVEPKLLLMSNSPKQGFVGTSKFYFPVNHGKDLIGSIFSFQINDFGYDGINLEWSSALLSDGGLIGDCQNSGYCVSGKVKQ